ncbi:hypothetical protein MRY17_05685 [Pseudomonas orientalis]|uniref:hypothetical protein n=1 Tax=Pseudomonas orientalis TaxID=76758 RepID=UPI001FAF8334|nr:hypothetical protein [Pseudomonas orientalis]UOB25189.1 hypothetical protein MRY17_05685 [Pseudomonas orientalis]
MFDAQKANPLLAAEGLLVVDDTWPVYVQGAGRLPKVTLVGDAATGYCSSIMAGGLAF